MDPVLANLLTSSAGHDVVDSSDSSRSGQTLSVVSGCLPDIIPGAIQEPGHRRIIAAENGPGTALITDGNHGATDEGSYQQR